VIGYGKNPTHAMGDDSIWPQKAQPLYKETHPQQSDGWFGSAEKARTHS
jgi:hypothetical protein